MTTCIIWGRINSVNVQKVVWMAGECGVAFERRDAGMQFGINSTPEFKAKNPNALIPLLEDGDVSVWESNAILRYLGAKYASGTLWADDAGERSLADRWMDWTATALNAAMGPVFLQLVRTPPEKRDPAIIEAGIPLTNERLALVDAHLSRQPYLAGDSFTMAECALGPFVHRWFRMDVPKPELPHLSRWLEGLRARPAAKPALPDAVT